jgi:hypothetical protein
VQLSCSHVLYHPQLATTVGVATMAEMDGIAAIITAAAVLSNRRGADPLHTLRRPQKSSPE